MINILDNVIFVVQALAYKLEFVAVYNAVMVVHFSKI